MSTKLPYVAQPSIIEKILDKVRGAKTPDRFTPDFLTTVIGYKGGNARQFIPLAKKLGFLNSDGTPTELYKSFRNTTSSKIALGQGIKNAYHEIFQRNEYAGSLSKKDFEGLVVEITGHKADDQVVKLICKTFETLKSKAKFNAKIGDTPQVATQAEQPIPDNSSQEVASLQSNLGLGLSYTINLVLPKTDDPAVFNAIFRSLRDNLLQK